MNEETNVMTINSHGSCSIVDGPSMWAFVGPIIGIHALLMITTNVILYKVRNVGDRYQEQKYIALCSLFVCEVLVVGLPVVVSVGANSTAVFVVLSGIIALNDIGTLCFVFIPKIRFQRKGVDEGIGFGETILKMSHKKASYRESIRKSSEFSMSKARRSHSGSQGFGLSSSSQLSDLIEVPESDSNDREQALHRHPSIKTPIAVDDEENTKEFGDDDKDVEKSTLLRSKYDEMALRNYDLELEIDEVKEREALLKKKIQELEQKLMAKI